MAYIVPIHVKPKFTYLLTYLLLVSSLVLDMLTWGAINAVCRMADVAGNL